MLKKSKKEKKNQNLKQSKFYQKIAIICHIKQFKNYFMAIKNLSVTYYQTT